MSTVSIPRPVTIDNLGSAVYPALAMLAGTQLDLFTPLKDGPKSGEQIADAIGLGSARLQPLLYTLLGAGLLTLEGRLFANTQEADYYLVRGLLTAFTGEPAASLPKIEE
jgi:hypothetical protein